MNLLRLAWKNISGNSLRSWVVALCALVVAAFALFSTLLLRGAAASLELAADRLGADIIVVPEGAQTEMEGALLMGVPAHFWMPEENVAKLAAIPGVEAVTPQVYLATLIGASCCSVSEMFMIAYDPATDFTVRPWLEARLPAGLALGEVIGGDYISATEEDNGILVYGALVTLRGNLEPTGTGLDQSLFFTLETAHELARVSEIAAEEPLVIPPGQVSAVLLKTKPGLDTEALAVEIYRTVPGVYPIQSANLFQSSRTQLKSLLNTVVIIMALIWPLAILLIGMIYLMAANERRRELGVLRALGATRRFVCESLLAEASLLAFCGASVGVFIAVLAIYLFRRLIMVSLGVPFLLPSAGSLALQIGIGVLLSMLSVFLAALFPALKISRQDPAIAMRE
ncbi:MAG: ABC transporter permease [Chloroflexi bacterium]|nr:ABC transporter permease [Chloroflexota bacterium]